MFGILFQNASSYPCFVFLPIERFKKRKKEKRRANNTRNWAIDFKDCFESDVRRWSMCYLCCSVIDVVNPRFSLCNPTSLATFVYESVAFTVDHVSSSLSLHHLFKHMPTSQHGEYKFMESYGQWSIALCFWHWELPVSSTTGKLSVRLAQMDHSLKYS